MSRESVDAKALRYIAEKRVLIRRVEGRDVDAEVRGGQTWYVQRRRGGWRCDCPTFGRCCHLTAVRLVTEEAQ